MVKYAFLENAQKKNGVSCIHHPGERQWDGSWVCKIGMFSCRNRVGLWNWSFPFFVGPSISRCMLTGTFITLMMGNQKYMDPDQAHFILCHSI